jgi:dihydroorotase
MLVLEGRAFFRGGLESLAIGIEAGRIARIAKTLRGDEHRDYGESLILPGGVDLHVHFRDPGDPHKEDFSSGTAAAAVGGVTTILDMPNTKPAVTSRRLLEEKLEAVRRKAHVDFGLYGALRSAEDVRAFSGIAAGGKLYMAPTTGGLEVSDPATLTGIVGAAAEVGLFMVAHAEAPWRFGKEEGRTLPAHNHMRPAEAEASAIQALAEAAKEAAKPPRIHIAHLTSQAGFEALAHTAFTAEVTTHHLLLEATMPLHQGGKVNPPLREAADRQVLWSALANGHLHALASDHAPHTMDEKALPFEQAPAGIPGVETMLPLMLRAVKRGDLTIERFVEASATGPANLLGLNAGTIAEGRVANLVIVDPRDIAVIRAKGLHSKCGWTPYEKMEAIFPRATYVRGELAVENRTLVGERLGKPIPVASATTPPRDDER